MASCSLQRMLDNIVMVHIAIHLAAASDYIGTKLQLFLILLPNNLTLWSNIMPQLAAIRSKTSARVGFI